MPVSDIVPTCIKEYVNCMYIFNIMFCIITNFRYCMTKITIDKLIYKV